MLITLTLHVWKSYHPTVKPKRCPNCPERPGLCGKGFDSEEELRFEVASHYVLETTTSNPLQEHLTANEPILAVESWIEAKCRNWLFRVGNLFTALFSCNKVNCERTWALLHSVVSSMPSTQHTGGVLGANANEQLEEVSITHTTY